MKVKFTQKDWDKLRTFQESMAKMFGQNAYVGSDHACVVLEYSPQLKAMLRPYPPETFFEFEPRRLVCYDCKGGQMYLCAKDETTFVCVECTSAREKKKQKERDRQKNKS